MTEVGLEKEARETVMMFASAYAKAYAYAEKLGVVILDTKLEGATLTLADEILTPDSSRFALKKDWEMAMKEGRDPNFLDKQPVRDWGLTVETPLGITGINKLSPESPDDLAFVHSIQVPNKVIWECTNRYLKTFKMLTGQTLRSYQVNRMLIPLSQLQ